VALLIVTSTVFGLTGCNKAKALQTVRQADELSAKLLIYGRNIALANNESFQKGNIPAAVHLATNKAADAYLKGVDVFLAGIVTAKKAIAAGASPDGQINILQALFDREVVQSAVALANIVTTLPPELANRIGGWVAAIQLGVSSFRALFADAHTALNSEVNHA
jgi:hypothetical protein